jgi:UDP-glucose 4-epimerase
MRRATPYSRTAIVTGSSGFVGEAVCTAFANMGWRTVGLSRRPSDSDGIVCDLAVDPIGPALDAINPDVIVHCAGSADVRGSFSDRDSDFRNNVLATQRLLSAIAVNAPAATTVVCSSAAAIGGGTLAKPLPPESPYGMHKLMVEWLARDYASSIGIDVRIARIYSAYGPGLRRQVVYDFCRQALANGRISAMGTGRERRDFVFIDDLGKILASLAQSDALHPGAIVEVGSGQPVAMAEIAHQICQAAGSCEVADFTGSSDSNSIMEMSADARLLQTVYPTEPTSLSEGINRTFHWVRRSTG